jgi:rubredoxin
LRAIFSQYDQSNADFALSCKQIFCHPFPSKGLFMKTYMCVICGFVYEEEKGLPDQGIAPGTKWADVPMNWKCPECGAGKEDFEMVEI